MTISEEQLRELIQIRVTLDNREGLPYEERFAKAFDPSFTPDEINERNPAYRRISGLFGKESCPHAPIESGAMCDLLSLEGASLSEHAKDIGEKVFGGWFDINSKKFKTGTFAILYTDSPYLNKENYLAQHLDLKKTKSKSVFPDISTLHEAGHVVLGGGAQSPVNEVLADGFAVYYARKYGGDSGAIPDYIAMRRLQAFFGNSEPEYITALACENVLNREGWIAVGKEAAIPVMQLQSLVSAELCSEPVTETSFEEETRRMHGSFEAEFNKARLMMKMGFLFRSAPEIIDGLELVLDKVSFMPSELREEGEKTLAAYDNLVGDRDLSDRAEQVPCNPRSAAPFGGKRLAL
ncbi:MAG: hypothetical protein PHE27_01490 [Alphaproteobacteria bacterium]|nr:hypothetical protein [Alphaproteobacteria bacterium]